MTIAAHGGVVGTLLGTLVPLLPAFLPALAGALIITRRYALAAMAAGAVALICPAYSSVDGALRVSRSLSDRVWTLTNDHDWSSLWNTHQWPVLAGLSAGLIAFIDPPEWMTRDWHRFREKYQPASTPYYRNRSVEPAFWFIELLWISLYRILFCVAMVGAAVFTFFYLVTMYNVPHDLDTVSEILRRPWLAVEQISLGDQSPHHVGYTITTKDNWHLILEDKTRTITYLVAKDVKSRKACVLRRQKEIPVPLIQLRNSAYQKLPICDPPRTATFQRP
jgi:hypothetical protein